MERLTVNVPIGALVALAGPPDLRGEGLVANVGHFISLERPDMPADLLNSVA